MTFANLAGAEEDDVFLALNKISIEQALAVYPQTNLVSRCSETPAAAQPNVAQPNAAQPNAVLE